MGVMESRRGPVLDRILAQYLQGYHPNPPKPPPPGGLGVLGWYLRRY